MESLVTPVKSFRLPIVTKHPDLSGKFWAVDLGVLL